MKIAVIGAGAMGSLFAARLLDAGAEVTLVDVDERLLEALHTDGLRLEDEQGTRVYWPRVARAEQLQGEFDALLMLTKSYHARQAMQASRHLLGQQTLVLTLQNGLDSVPVLREFVADRCLAMGMTLYPADVLAPGSVRSCGGGEVRLRGLLPGAGQAGPLQALIDGLRRGGMRCIEDPDIEVSLWEKVAFNTALNSLCALTGNNVGELGRCARGREVALALVAEAASIAASVGVALDPQRVVLAVEEAFVVHAGHKPSMLQDLEHGRRMEIDALSGALLGHARRQGVRAPAMAAIDRLLRRVQRQRSGEKAAGR
ncbi:ketopantoate reductase family protein [Pseudomonas sp. CC120222-01a]|uniref:ketopantoate reductase family protein n=1 Tax=Pseudomonas sp. CC120222-01a TaxID=1378075 RepID=UPI000D953AD0|nr:2-dehydropantoate 2-reductase [Pseudomonas sp. CC120222-01a]PVZ39070.1 2-dehydropantoate 2-reductase [Pseudomonas sp. CC120222-01a]